MRLHLCALLAALAALPAWANQKQQHLCVEQVEFEANKLIAPFKIHAVSTAEVAGNYIFSLGDRIGEKTIIGFIRGNRFIPLEGRHPETFDMNDIYTTAPANASEYSDSSVRGSSGSRTL